MKLTTKLFVLFLLILLFFGGIAYYATARFQHEILEKEISLTLAEDARAHLDNIDRLIAEGLNDIQYLSSSRLIASRKATPRQIEEAMKSFLNQNPQYVAATFFDLNRAKVATAGQGSGSIGMQHALNEYWPAVYQGRERIVDISMSTSLQVPTAHFVNPVKDDSGSVLGVLVLRAPVSEFFRMVPSGVRPNSRKSSYHVDLLDSDGLVLYSNHDPASVLHRVDDDFKAIGLSAGVAGEKDGYRYLRKAAAKQSDGRSAGDQLVIFSREQGFRDFKGSGWILKVAIPANVALESLRVLEEKMAGLMLFVTMLALAASLVGIWSMVIRPIKRLDDAMHQVGQGELEWKLPVRSNDEMGSLFQQFNAMSESLHRMRMNLDQAVHEAKAASQIKSDFLANMSHEIRTPMNAIIGLTLLCLQTELSAKQQDYLQKIRTSAHALLRIINDILDLSKIEAGKMDVEHVHFTLGEVLDNLVTVTVNKSEEKGLELLLDTPLGVPFSLMGDPLRLGQILVNLTGNAIKFTQRGEVLVRVELEEETSNEVVLRFSVIDTGIGLTREQMDSLFQPFVQADTSITRKFGGTGLGLSICKNLVELMGGRIWVESTPGQGSKFMFTARFGKVEWRTGKHVVQSAADLKDKNLLIVDDNETSRRILQSYLEPYAKQVTLVASGAEALENFRDGRAAYDIVLVDSRMPGMSGIETARRILDETGPDKGPKILLLTLTRDDEKLQQFSDSGLVAGILSKPFHQAQLLKAVMGILLQQSEMKQAGRRKSVFDLEIARKLRGARLLLVEDNPINQQVGRELLEKLGITVVIANHGEEALAILQRETFDGVLMDMQMPVMDGVTATERIRQQLQLTELPIIAMTANAMLKDRESCLTAGMNDYIDKPIDVEKLIATLARWIVPAQPAAEPTVVAVQPPAQKEWDLPGINVSNAVRRLGGSSDIYRKILLDFRRDQQNVVPEIRSALSVADEKPARLLVHTLKGLLGTIGADQLAQQAAELERAIQNREKDRVEPLLEQLSSALDALFGAIDANAAPASQVGV